MKENTKINMLLGEGNLYAALQLLKPLAVKTSDFRLTDRLQSIEQNYKYLIDYFVSGAEDPDRDNILNQLFQQTFLLYDDIRKATAEQMQDILQMKSTAAEYKPKDDKYSHLKQIFYTTWLGTRTNDNLLITDEEKNIYVSALMLNIIDNFSEEKTIALSQLTATYTGEPAQRAKVALLMVLHHYKYRIKYFQKLCAQLKLLCSDDRMRGSMMHIVVQLLNTSLTPAIVEEMESLSKDFQQQAGHDNNNIFIALEDNEETNPEWGDSARSMLDQHLENVGRLHGEGGDMNYSSTRPLLGNRFFTTDIANWFIPFGFDNPDTGIDFTADNAKLLKGILLSNIEACDIDRYAICTIFNQLQQQLHGTKLPSVIEDMKQFGDIESITDNYSEENMSLYYVRALYRFFKHNRWKITDLMSDITSIGSEYAMTLLLGEKESDTIADRCLRLNLFREAIDILDKRNDRLSLQKKGYAQQKTGDYTGAIVTYDKALLYEEDRWTLTHKAYCLQKNEEYERALSIYNQLLESDHDNRKLLLNKAQCLILLDKTQEALEVFFHLDLLYPDNTNIERGLAWCAFVTATTENGNYRLAEQYLEKNAYRDHAEINDLINYGHLLLVTGHRSEAISLYRQAAADKDNVTTMLKQINSDKDLLLTKGISEADFVLVTEAIKMK